jgi:hypothetical protein
MSNKTLWDFYDGEPFMENPQLGILGVINPRKGRKKMAVRRRKNVRRRRTHHRKAAPARRRRTNVAPRRRRRARRNWLTSGMVVPANPRRRRRSRRMSNPHRKHHRRHQRNPAFLGMSVPPIKTIAFGAVGFVGPSFVSGMLNSFAPSVMQTVTSFGIAGKYIVKAGSVGLLAWLTKRFVGAGEAMSVAIGGGINIAVSLVNDFAPGVLPANPLAMYMPTRTGMRAYVPVRGGLRAAPMQLQANSGSLPYSRRQIPTAAGFTSALTSTTQYGKFGGTAARFFRY